MEREYKIGQHIIFVDPKGCRRDALVTIWWQDSAYNYSLHKPDAPMPGVNLIIVSDDPMRSDPYGRQTEHETSVVHKSQQPASGNFWVWPDE